MKFKKKINTKIEGNAPKKKTKNKNKRTAGRAVGGAGADQYAAGAAASVGQILFFFFWNEKWVTWQIVIATLFELERIFSVVENSVKLGKTR